MHVLPLSCDSEEGDLDLPFPEYFYIYFLISADIKVHYLYIQRIQLSMTYFDL